MRVLGIETSCDETAVAIYDSRDGLLSHLLHSQISLHAQYGGVVPELASRDHICKLLPLTKEVLKKARCTWSDLQGIAYTQAPGLMGALLVGATFGRALGYALTIPTLGVNHLEAHLLAPFLEEHHPNFPFLALLVSGGHTQLIQVEAIGEYKLLGETLDDAAGEGFDKVAKILGLPYPGGPILSKLAQEGCPGIFEFPEPMRKNKELNFSFSGLKTAVLQAWEKSLKTEQIKKDIAYAFQKTVVDALISKTMLALEKNKLNNVVVAGGVSANTLLRKKMDALSLRMGLSVFYPRLEFCTDNAAMVAYTGCYYLDRGISDKNLKIQVKARGSLL